MGTERQRRRKSWQRAAHAQGETWAEPEVVEPDEPVVREAAEAPEPQAGSGDTDSPRVKQLRNMSVWFYTGSTGLWVLSTVIHRGHQGAAVAAVGCTVAMALLCWSLIIPKTEFMQKGYYLIDSLGVACLLGPILIFGLGALLGPLWWIGLIIGAVVTVGCFAGCIILDNRRIRKQ